MTTDGLRRSRRLSGGLTLIGLFTLLTGCGPIFDTVYTFTPPASSEGKACTFQCENMKMQCEELEELKYERCQSQAEYEQETCKWNMELRGKKEKWYDCPLESCTNDSDRCEKKHHTCYQACGGKVTARSVCVMNCDQLAGKGTPPTPE